MKNLKFCNKNGDALSRELNKKKKGKLKIKQKKKMGESLDRKIFMKNYL